MLGGIVDRIRGSVYFPSGGAWDDEAMPMTYVVRKLCYISRRLSELQSQNELTESKIECRMMQTTAMARYTMTIIS
jgi:hypothetical protein